MPRVQILASPERPSGHAKQAAVIRSHLGAEYQTRFAIWDTKTPTMRSLWEEVRRDPPDILHTFGRPATLAGSVLRLAARRTNLRWVSTGGPDRSDRIRHWICRHAIPLILPPVADLLPVVTDDASVANLPAKYILAVGSFHRRADITTALWAFDAVNYARPDIDLVLLGNGPMRPAAAHLVRTMRSGRATQVHFPGVRGDVRPYLAGASVVWVTNRSGGLNFLLEAMSLGMPVVAARSADTERVVSSGVNGYLVPHTAQVDLATVTVGLLENPARASTIGRAGRETATRYGPDALVRSVLAVYDTPS